MIRGFDAAVADMEVGQIIDVHLMPEEAYGMADPNAIFTMEIAQLPGSEDLTVGQQVYLSNQFCLHSQLAGEQKVAGVAVGDLH